MQREQNESAWDRLGAKITDEIKAAVQEAGVSGFEVDGVQRALALRGRQISRQCEKCSQPA